jgi:hypothetical protein
VWAVTWVTLVSIQKAISRRQSCSVSAVLISFRGYQTQYSKVRTRKAEVVSVFRHGEYPDGGDEALAGGNQASLSLKSLGYLSSGTGSPASQNER